MSDKMRERVLERIQALGTNANAVAKATGCMDRSVLRKFLATPPKIRELKDQNVRALAKVLKCSPAYLRGDTDIVQDLDKSASEFFVIPQYLDVRIYAELEPFRYLPIDWFEGMDLGVIENGLNPQFAHTKQYGYRVVGNYMDGAGITDGDLLVAVDPSKVDWGDGDLVIVEVFRRKERTRELTVRQLTERDGHWEAIALSRSSPKPLPAIFLPKRIDPNADEVAQVKAIVTSVIRRKQFKTSAKGMLKAATGRAKETASGAKRVAHTMVAAAFALVLGVSPCYACSLSLEDQNEERAHLYENVGIQNRRHAWETMEQAKAVMVAQTQIAAFFGAVPGCPQG